MVSPLSNASRGSGTALDQLFAMPVAVALLLLLPTLLGLVASSAPRRGVPALALLPGLSPQGGDKIRGDDRQSSISHSRSCVLGDAGGCDHATARLRDSVRRVMAVTTSLDTWHRLHKHCKGGCFHIAENHVQER